MEIHYDGKRYAPKGKQWKKYLIPIVGSWIKNQYLEEIKEEPSDLEARYEKYMSKADREDHEQDLNALRNSLEKEYNKAMDEIHGVVDVVKIRDLPKFGTRGQHDFAKDLKESIEQLQQQVFNQ